ncbi:hypothetical protein SLY_0262 [Strawberry lethal yellows phytoplasma (CPA) str. NZSb11]|uniref:Uncharacterized protein n=1 Tax=Strawberry lethal yellows phytoplasma (CPA) str. NZSb11 TaxID=980422 RepID=R4S055_PHYAS|nr:hypothetical protein SLY_0262 [Strawberry lethal yellows phytoplasma (CPA) str. NZSb11]
MLSFKNQKITFFIIKSNLHVALNLIYQDFIAIKSMQKNSAIAFFDIFFNTKKLNR